MNTVSFTITFHAAQAALVAFVFLGILLAALFSFIRISQQYDRMDSADTSRAIAIGTALCLFVYAVTLVLALIYAINTGILQ